MTGKLLAWKEGLIGSENQENNHLWPFLLFEQQVLRWPTINQV